MPNLTHKVKIYQGGALFQHVQELVLCQPVKPGEPVVFSTRPRTAHDAAVVKRKAIGTHTPPSVTEFVLQAGSIDLITRICGKAVENCGDNLSLCHNSKSFWFPYSVCEYHAKPVGILKSRWRVA